MQEEIAIAEEYLNTIQDLADIKVKLVSVATSVILEGLEAIQDDYCPKCAYAVLEQMRDDLIELSDALRDEYEAEKSLLLVFEDRIGMLMKDIENLNLDLRYCATKQAINN